jgi:chromosome segregation ATPase
MPLEQRNVQTDLAVLQTEFKNLNEKFDDIKQDVKALDIKMESYAETTYALLKEVQRETHSQHNVIEEKVNHLERWRWMMMGAGVGLGALGYSGFDAFFL